MLSKLEQLELILVEKEYQRDKLLLLIDDELKKGILHNTDNNFITGDLTNFNKYVDITTQINNIMMDIESYKSE